MKWNEVKWLSHVRLFLTPWTKSYQAPRSMGFSRQEYWSGLPFPSPGIFPTKGLNHKDLLNGLKKMSKWWWLWTNIKQKEEDKNLREKITERVLWKSASKDSFLGNWRKSQCTKLGARGLVIRHVDYYTIILWNLIIMALLKLLLICIVIWEKPTQHGEEMILQYKKKETWDLLKH